jgi:AcrR family transcriptional regulator
MAMPSDAEATLTDGRRARRDRNKNAVLDAMIELFTAEKDPTPEDIAAVCGLSPRSVYRYFEDRDALILAAIERNEERLWPLFRIQGFGKGPLEIRIDRFVQSRLSLYEANADLSRATRRRAAGNELIRANAEFSQEQLRAQLIGQFALELEPMDGKQSRSTIAALDALTQFEGLDYYRVTRKFSNAATITMLIDTFYDLLGD